MKSPLPVALEAGTGKNCQLLSVAFAFIITLGRFDDDRYTLRKWSTTTALGTSIVVWLICVSTLVERLSLNSAPVE